MLDEAFRVALRDSITEVRKSYPFAVDAWVLLPDHLHCIWTLPENDDDFSTRWRLVKSGVTKKIKPIYFDQKRLSKSRSKSSESTLWQRRFWEHRIKDDKDFASHMDYIHFNPVKHGLGQKPNQWLYSTFELCVKKGLYDLNWGDSVLYDEKYWRYVEDA